MNADVPRHRRRVRAVLPSVAEVMSPPVTVTVWTLLLDALALFVSTGLRHLVVVDGEGRYAGVLADRDVVAVWAADPAALERRGVGAIVTAEPAIDVEAAVAEVAVIMCDSGVDGVAVIDADNHPVGMVTGSDLAAWLARR